MKSSIINLNFVKQIILIKYYNRIMILKLEKTFIESWNFLRKEKNDNHLMNNVVDPFKILNKKYFK